jgi:hypothetical protein
MVRPKVVLEMSKLQEETVEAIYAATPPGWTVEESQEPVKPNRLGGNTLFCILGESKRGLHIRFAGGSSFSMLYIPIRDLPAFFTTVH